MSCWRLIVVLMLAAESSLLTRPLSAQSSADSSARASVPRRGQALDTLRISGRQEPATRGYAARRSRTATRTDTPLRDVPQAVAIVTAPLMRDQAMRGMADVVRFIPGVGMAQGEGNRDAPVLRGNTSTGDLFVDGLRDDVQYFRDLYNVERVEAIKGPNAMIFGRGGAGGILNRVTKQPTFAAERALAIQGGAVNERRITGDVGDAITPSIGLRVSALLEQDDSFRGGVSARREGIAPSIAWRAGERTTWRASLEHFRDVRTADRGLPSISGRPVDLALYGRTFFGDPSASRSTVTARLATAGVTHQWASGARLDSRLLVAGYDKFYRNVYAAGAVDPAARTLPIGAYQNATLRQNIFWQTDLSWARTTGPVVHRLLAGVELGRQSTDNLRLTGYFAGNTAALAVPLAAPTTSAPITWRPSATDANQASVANIAAVYVQDQLVLTPWLEAVAGLRVDHFQLDVENRRTNATFASTNTPLSPRIGLIAKPADALSLYASWSTSFVPRGGDQLSSLTVTNQALAPEEFRNREVGAKWDATERLALTAAVYALERANVVVPDPRDPSRTWLASAQRTEGVELGITGALSARWQVAGGYAFQDGRFTQAVSTTVKAGARLANLPRHTLTLWQRVELSPSVGVGLGVQKQSAMYAATDNAVALPGFTRLDAALFVRLDPTWTAQLNVDNLLDAQYVASAHNNDNLMPAMPRTVRVVLRASR